MNNGTRILFALPALIAGVLVLWLVLAGRQIVPGPQEFFARLQQINCLIPSGSAQNTGLKT